MVKDLFTNERLECTNKCQRPCRQVLLFLTHKFSSSSIMGRWYQFYCFVARYDFTNESKEGKYSFVTIELMLRLWSHQCYNLFIAYILYIRKLMGNSALYEFKRSFYDLLIAALFNWVKGFFKGITVTTVTTGNNRKTVITYFAYLFFQHWDAYQRSENELKYLEYFNNFGFDAIRPFIPWLFEAAPH